MARLEFYFNEDERKELINFILCSKTKIVPDILYSTPKYKSITNLSEFEYYIASGVSRYFLFNNRYSYEDLSFIDIDSNEGLKYKIKQRVGGPYIDLVLYFGYSSDSIIPYRMSIIDYYPKFFSLEGHEYKASSELKDYFMSLTKFIKLRCKIILKDNIRKLVSLKVLDEMKL